MALDGEVRINSDRLWQSLVEMAAIGATPGGGVHRLTLTDEDRVARDLFVGWCRAAGLAVSVDRVGNIFARRRGEGESLPPVLVGSHLDSQPMGGKYDGALGVLAALEIVRTLNDRAIRTLHPIEIVNWTNEEGARFRPGMIGSGVFAGANTLDQAFAGTDSGGKVFGEELHRIGYGGETVVGGREIRAYYELHIEQGPLLEGEGLDVGIVTAAVGQRWYEVTLTGVASHAGTTPMSFRHDALLGAARVVEAVNRIATELGAPAVGTVGRLNALPGSPNVIAGHAILTVEFRHPDPGALGRADRRLRDEVADIAARGGLAAEIKDVIALAPTAFDPECVATLRRAAARLGYRQRDMVSGAGHDAVYLSRVAPAAMVFCPCVGGLSHNEAEAIRPEWAAAGANVLLHAVAATAGLA